MAREPEDVRQARLALKNAMLEVRHIQKTEGSGGPVLRANRALVVPAGRALDALLPPGRRVL